MKLAAPVQKRLIALHGWSATILSILLYTVVLTGTVVVFIDEIYDWSVGVPHMPAPLEHKIGPTVERLAQQVPAELRQDVSIGPGTDNTLRVIFTGVAPDLEGHPSLFARLFRVDLARNSIVDAQGGKFSDLSFFQPENALQRFLLDLHIRLHVPGRLGLYLTGALGIAMLVAAVTGVMIHRHVLKEIFVTTRPGGKVVSYRDKHNLAGVWSLPFAVLLAFTGAYLSFAISLGLPVVAMVAFGGDQEKAIETVLHHPPFEGIAAGPSADLDQVLTASRAQVGTPVEHVDIHNYGLANAEIHVRHVQPQGYMRAVNLKFDGTTGAFVQRDYVLGQQPSAGNTMVELMGPLHFGNFASLWSKLVWGALGAAMTYTIVTGLQLWLRRRATQGVWRAGEAVFACVVWGLPLAMVGAAWGFFTTRLVGDPMRWTENAFVITAFLVFGLALVQRGDPVERLNAMLRRWLGLALLGLPLVRVFMGGLAWGEALLTSGVNVLFVDGLCAIMGALCLWQPGMGLRTETSALAKTPAE